MSVGTGTVNFFYPADAGKYDANDENADYEFTKYEVRGDFAPVLRFLTHTPAQPFLLLFASKVAHLTRHRN